MGCVKSSEAERSAENAAAEKVSFSMTSKK